MTNYLLDILFPWTCPVCAQALKNDEYLCSDCMSRLDRTEEACNRDNLSESLFVNEKHFVWGGCWLHYQKGTYLQQLIHWSKFGQGNPMLLQQLGRQAAMEWEGTGFFDGVDMIIPIPLHKSRLRERGFNQSEYIARGLSEVLFLPMNTDYLERIRATKKQSQSTFEERQKGIVGAFAINHPEELYGKTILLVDDILTTGSTLRAAMAAFDQVYGCKLVVFALAKAK